MRFRCGPSVGIRKQRWIRRFSLLLVRPTMYLYYRLRYRAYPDPNKDLLIDPYRIVAWCRGNIYDRISFPGQIKGGDWAGRVTPKDEYLRENLKYKAMAERFGEQREWLHTTLFRDHFAGFIPEGRKLPMGASTLEELAEKYERTYGQIFEEIKKLGVRSARGGVKPLYVCLGRNGEYYYTVDGNHRLAMVMVLKLDRIPVRVLRRHRAWQIYREDLLRKLQRGEISADDIKKIGHEDLDDLYS